MRKFGKSNKIAFAVFELIIAAAVGGLGFLVYSNLGAREPDYIAAAGSTVFDSYDNIIAIETDTVISKRQNGDYCMSIDMFHKVNFGQHPVVYDPSSAAVDILGACRRIYPDGSVLNNEGVTHIVDFSDTGVYKLCDRLYLMIGESIDAYEGVFGTNDFIRINIDRSGSALFTGSDLSSKTIDPVVLNSAELYFDVSSELLYSPPFEVNMRKVFGSTNEYDGVPALYEKIGAERPSTSTANTRVPDIEQYDVAAGAGGDGGTGGDGGKGGKGGTGGDGGTGGTGGTGGKGGTGGMGGSGGLGGTGGMGGSGGDGGIGGNGGKAYTTDRFEILVNSITAGPDSIKIDYRVSDPGNNIARMTASISDGESTKEYALNTLSESYTIYDLSPGTVYTVKITANKYEVDNGERRAGDPFDITSAQVRLDSPVVSVVTASIDELELHLNVSLKGYDIDFSSTPSSFTVTGEDRITDPDAVDGVRPDGTPSPDYREDGISYGNYTLSKACVSEDGQDITIPLKRGENNHFTYRIYIKAIDACVDGKDVSIPVVYNQVVNY